MAMTNVFDFVNELKRGFPSNVLYLYSHHPFRYHCVAKIHSFPSPDSSIATRSPFVPLCSSFAIHFLPHPGTRFDRELSVNSNKEFSYNFLPITDNRTHMCQCNEFMEKCVFHESLEIIAQRFIEMIAYIDECGHTIRFLL